MARIKIVKPKRHRYVVSNVAERVTEKKDRHGKVTGKVTEFVFTATKKRGRLTREERWERAERRYCGWYPHNPSAGRVLVHNHVIPQYILGMNGFRAWTQRKDSVLLEVCRCNWAGRKLPVKVHYRVKR